MGKKWKTIKDDTDSLIEIAYKAKYNNVMCPPKEEVWSKVKKNLTKNRRNSIKKRSFTAAALLLVLTGIFFVSNSTSVGALTSKIIKSIINITEDTFNVRKKVDINSGSDNINIEFDDPRLEETQNKIHFDMSVPRYMPNDYRLENIKVLNDNKEQEHVSLCYINGKQPSERGFIQIDQESNPDGTSISLNVLREADTQMKEIKIDGLEYVLFIYSNGFCKIMWDKGNISYMINGKISEGEIIKIAESMK